MAKINIPFDNTNYSIDESAISTASAALKSHLQTVMNGSGATINLGGAVYNVDSAKLTAATNAFVTHLGTVAGSGKKVVVNGVEYGIDSAKMASAITELHTVLGGLHSDDGDEGALPEKNEYGFYFGVPYIRTTKSDGVETSNLVTFYEDGSVSNKIYINGILSEDSFDIPAGSFIYEYNKILNGAGEIVFVVVDDGTCLMDDYTSDTYYLELYGDKCQYIAGLYETGAISLYKEQGPEAIQDMLITPWDELVDTGAIAVDNGAVRYGTIIPDNLPEKNEYGFYFGVSYEGNVYYEDGSYEYYEDNELIGSFPAGTIAYSANTIDMSSVDYGVAQVSDDGLVLIIDTGYDSIYMLYLGEKVNFAFAGDLFMPDDGSVTAIAPQSFMADETLTGVKIPIGVTSIGYNAFSECSRLTTVTIPDSVTDIGEYAFYECSRLTTVTIGDSVTSIDNFAFSNCSDLTSITIPDSVTIIGDSAFENCSSLTNITFEGTMKQWKAIATGSYWNYNIPATQVVCSDKNYSLLPT